MRMLHDNFFLITKWMLCHKQGGYDYVEINHETGGIHQHWK